MGKLKTKKSVAKRFKITGTGKVIHYGAGGSHLLSKKSSKRKRRIKKAKVLIENVELFDKTKLLSITDSLTQTYNRRYLEKVLSDILTKSQLNYSPVSIAMCDVDYFKFYNDTNGHPAGDYVLKTIAEILKKGVKGSDIVARYGGEEFIIIFPDTTKENAIKICEKLRKSIKDFKFPNEESQPNGDLTISFGIASFPEDGIKAEELIKKADIALYKAKELGKDRVIPA